MVRAWESRAQARGIAGVIMKSRRCERKMAHGSRLSAARARESREGACGAGASSSSERQYRLLNKSI